MGRSHGDDRFEAEAARSPRNHFLLWRRCVEYWPAFRIRKVAPPNRWISPPCRDLYQYREREVSGRLKLSAVSSGRLPLLLLFWLIHLSSLNILTCLLASMLHGELRELQMHSAWVHVPEISCTPLLVCLSLCLSVCLLTITTNLLNFHILFYSDNLPIGRAHCRVSQAVNQLAQPAIHPFRSDLSRYSCNASYTAR